MKKIKQHVERLFKDVPDSEEKEILKQEIIDNLEEKVLDLMEQGKEEEDAVNKAIIDFGDIDEIKVELTVKRQPLKKNMSKINLVFSIWGSILIIGLFIFMNLYYSPNVIWFVYPTFVVLWWPLSMLFYWLRNR